MGEESRIVYSLHRRMILKEFCKCGGVSGVSFHAHIQCFEAACQEPRVPCLKSVWVGVRGGEGEGKRESV